MQHGCGANRGHNRRNQFFSSPSLTLFSGGVSLAEQVLRGLKDTSQVNEASACRRVFVTHDHDRGRPRVSRITSTFSNQNSLEEEK